MRQILETIQADARQGPQRSNLRWHIKLASPLIESNPPSGTPNSLSNPATRMREAGMRFLTPSSVSIP